MVRASARHALKDTMAHGSGGLLMNQPAADVAPASDVEQGAVAEAGLSGTRDYGRADPWILPTR